MIGDPELLPRVVDDGYNLTSGGRDLVGLSVKFDVGTDVDFAGIAE